MDERIRRLVMSQPVPMRLADALYGARITSRPQVGVLEIRRTLALHYTLLLVVCGMTNHEIADEIGVSHDTVRRRVVRLLDLYQANNRTHLAALALRQNLEWPDTA